MKKHKLSKNVIYTGPVPHIQVFKYILQSWIGLCILEDNPKYRVEIPIKIFEYIACGIPVIGSTSINAFNKFITKNNAGISVETKSIPKIVNAVLTILDDYKKYSHNALRIGKKCIWEEGEFIKLYKEVIAKCYQKK